MPKGIPRAPYQQPEPPVARLSDDPVLAHLLASSIAEAEGVAAGADDPLDLDLNELPPVPEPDDRPVTPRAPEPTVPEVPKPVAVPQPSVAVPAGPNAAVLTAEQRRIKDLENQLALERGRKDPEPELEVPSAPGSKDNIVIHILADGFTALGHLWFRGQELEFEPGGGAYQDTCDRNGRSWLDLRDDDSAQIDRYGEVMFRSGPWPGKSYVEAAQVPFEQLRALKPGGDGVSGPTQEELVRAQVAEEKRRRAAPRLPVR